MTAQEILNVLSDSISDGKLDRDSQVTVVDYDCGDAKLKRIDLNYYKLDNKQITLSPFLCN